MGSGTTALQKSAETMSSDAVKMMPARSTVSVPVKTAATVGPTERETATFAHQLWLDRSRCPSIPRCDTRAESEMVAEFRYEGHWEVWESEWGGPRWTCDLVHSKALKFRIE